MNLTQREYDLLDLLYFTQSYESLLAESKLTHEELEELLIRLVQQGLVHQLFFDVALQDYLISDEFDQERMRNSAYVITKKGLLQHNSR